MNETNKKDPNVIETESRDRGERGASKTATALTALALTGGLGAGISAIAQEQGQADFQDQLTNTHVMEDYEKGEIDKSKVVVIKVTDAGNGNPDSIAVRINSKQSEKDGSMKTLSEQISAQADSQGYAGVESQETYVVGRELVDPNAEGIEFLQPEDLPGAELQK